MQQPTVEFRLHEETLWVLEMTSVGEHEMHTIFSTKADFYLVAMV